MGIKSHLRKVKNQVGLGIFLACHTGKKKFECPVCNYQGPFLDAKRLTGFRKHAECPKCGSMERHRLQYVVLSKVLGNLDTAPLKLLKECPRRPAMPGEKHLDIVPVCCVSS